MIVRRNAAAAALIAGDGLFSACSGNPNLPTWFAKCHFPTGSHSSK